MSKNKGWLVVNSSVTVSEMDRLETLVDQNCVSKSLMTAVAITAFIDLSEEEQRYFIRKVYLERKEEGYGTKAVTA